VNPREKLERLTGGKVGVERFLLRHVPESGPWHAVPSARGLAEHVDAATVRAKTPSDALEEGGLATPTRPEKPVDLPDRQR
jgi:hypothetical protein